MMSRKRCLMFLYTDGIRKQRGIFSSAIKYLKIIKNSSLFTPLFKIIITEFSFDPLIAGFDFTSLKTISSQHTEYNFIFNKIYTTSFKLITITKFS